MQVLEITRQFTSVLQNHFRERLISVVLFGSQARGDTTPHSDIDLLLVIKNLPEGRLTRRALLEPVLEEMDKQGIDAFFNCHLKTPDEAKHITVLYYDFPTDSKLLYDTDNFFKKIVEKVATHIQKTGAVRKKWGKFYYWDLKPGAKATDTFEIL